MTTCPNEANHTKHPSTYIEYMTWAEKMLKTHKQKLCPDCGLYLIWLLKTKPKKARETK